MKVNRVLIGSVLLLCYFSVGALHAAVDMDDFFDISLVELAAIPVTNATTSNTVAQSAAVMPGIAIQSTTVAEQYEVLDAIQESHDPVQEWSGDDYGTLRGIRHTIN